jgi:Zn-dependent protease with chaperone function
MTHDEYSALVSRLEKMAETKPASYRARVGALAVLGYAYVLGVMLLLLGALALLVWGSMQGYLSILLVKVGLPVLALLVAIGRALWVTVPPPDGRELRRDEAPLLFAEIDALRIAAKAPVPHRVILTQELNASVTQVPRLGILGWHRNYLSIGLPLLAALTPDQFRAVVAHEFGHLSRAHARFGNWIYRVRGMWMQIQTAIHQRRSRLGSLLVNKFVDWYEPYFRAYSFVLARRHEVEADETSASVLGAHVAAMALAAVTLRARYKDDVVWPSIIALAADAATPPRAAFSSYVERMPAKLPLPLASDWLAAALRVESGVDDAHPALADRLRLLGELPRDDASRSALAERLAMPIDSKSTAAAHFLGSLAPAVTTELDDKWRGKATSAWKDRHQHLARAREGLRELEARAAVVPLTPDEQFRVADWTEDLEGANAALPLVKSLVESCPEHASGLYMLGRILTSRDDDDGIAYLERAMAIDPSVTGHASVMIAHHLQQVGRRQDAIAYRMRAEASMIEAAAEAAERRRIETSDTITMAELDDGVRAKLREQLASYPKVGRAWVVRRATRRAPDRFVYVVGISQSAPWWRYESEGSKTYLTKKLVAELHVPAGTLIIVLDRKRRWLLRKMKRVPNSEVYRRGR